MTSFEKISVVFVVLLASHVSMAQTTSDAGMSSQTTSSAQPRPSSIYYGGTVGFNLFGDVFRLSVQPLVGYKITQKFSVGAKVGYEYIKDKRYDPDLIYHNYGASVFARYRFIPQLYAHAEFAELSYDYPSGREWVPFMLVGGGYAQRVAPSTWVVLEVLFDVMQSSKSPYKPWEPWISIGVGVGF